MTPLRKLVIRGLVLGLLISAIVTNVARAHDGAGTSSLPFDPGYDSLPTLPSE